MRMYILIHLAFSYSCVLLLVSGVESKHVGLISSDPDYHLPRMPLGIIIGGSVLFILSYLLYIWCGTNHIVVNDTTQAPVPPPGSQHDNIDDAQPPPTPSPAVSPYESSGDGGYRISVSTFPLEPFSGEGECCICLEQFEVGELIRVVPSCHHHYHDHCIRCWAETGSDQCPKCRQLYGVTI